MPQVLLVDACTQGPPQSRTAVLGDAFVSAYEVAHGDSIYGEHVLRELLLKPFTQATVQDRLNLLAIKAMEDPMFTLAHAFSTADIIVVTAPFWDCSFPAMLKTYFEHVCVQDITFEYQDDKLHGLCAAKDLVYITTRGGIYERGEYADMDMATPTIKAMARMFGIPNVHFLSAEGLDIVGAKVDSIMETATQAAISLAKAL